MNKDEAWRIIDELRNWNTSQKSISGDPVENALLDSKRTALAEAWKVVQQETAP